jgi:multiple sugar transport system permease protein
LITRRLRSIWRSEQAGAWLLLTPYLVGGTALIVVPGLLTLALSLFDYDLIRAPRFVGLQNLQELFADDVFRIAVRNSISFLAVAVPLRLIIVVGLALLLHASSMRGGMFYRVAVFLPVIIPEVAFAIAWLWMLNPLFGPLNSILVSAGIAPVAWFTDPGAAQSAIVLMSLLTIGEAFVIAVAARRSIPRDLYDMAAIDGARPLALFRNVTLPLMLPILLVLALRDVVLTLHGTFVPSLVVTGGGPPPYATTYGPLFIYQQAFEYLRYGYAAAATSVFLVLATVILLLQLRIIRRWSYLGRT